MRYQSLLLLMLSFMIIACGPQPLEIVSFEQHKLTSKQKEAIQKNRPDGIIYNIKQGDTLYAIARKFQINVRILINHNNLQPPYKLRRDDIIYIPDAPSYIVQQGDSLYGIAKKFNTSQNIIVRLNNITSPFILKIGQALILPVKKQVDNSLYNASYNTQTISNSNIVKAPSSKILQGTLKPIDNNTAKTKVTPKLSGKFIAPVNGKVIAHFGEQKRGLFNEGVNFALKENTPIRAAENGIVIYSDNKLVSYGNMILIKHDNGYVTAYAHNKANQVKRGDIVKRQQVIAFAGTTGNVTQSQLHFEIRKNNKTIDPLTLIQ